MVDVDKEKKKISVTKQLIVRVQWNQKEKKWKECGIPYQKGWRERESRVTININYFIVEAANEWVNLWKGIVISLLLEDIFLYWFNWSHLVISTSKYELLYKLNFIDP